MAKSSKKSKLVFIIDDDKHVGDILQIVVQDAGLESRLFHDPVAFLEMLPKIDPPPDLLITDFQMPVLNGLEVIARSKQIFPQLKTISVSGGLTNVTLRQYEVQPDALLAKPFHPKDLLAAISSVLEIPLPPWPES